MDKIYSVAVSCRGANGWVEYDTEAKTVKVFLSDEKAVADAEKFLSEKHKINIPQDSLGGSEWYENPSQLAYFG